MGIIPKFDKQKAIECILFVAESIPDFYPLLKVLYLADKLHLERYGRLISGDSYSALKKGPVPSHTYSLIQTTKGHQGFNFGVEDRGFIIKGYKVAPDRRFDPDELSESEIECLSEIIEAYKDRQWDLKKDSHDAAYKAYWRKEGNSTPIPLEEIVKTLPDHQDLLEHLGID